MVELGYTEWNSQSFSYARSERKIENSPMTVINLEGHHAEVEISSEVTKELLDLGVLQVNLNGNFNGIANSSIL